MKLFAGFGITLSGVRKNLHQNEVMAYEEGYRNFNLEGVLDMGQKMVRCAVIAGLILFVWGWISWAVFPWHKAQIHKFKNEERVASVVRECAPESGLYILPHMHDMHKNTLEMEVAKDKMREGPFIFASVSLEGKNPSMLPRLFKELILKIVLAFLVIWALMQTKMHFKKRVAFVTVMGVAISLAMTVPSGIWCGFPGSYVVATFVQGVVGWFLAGLAIGKMT